MVFNPEAPDNVPPLIGIYAELTERLGSWGGRFSSETTSQDLRGPRSEPRPARSTRMPFLIQASQQAIVNDWSVRLPRGGKDLLSLAFVPWSPWSKTAPMPWSPWPKPRTVFVMEP
jgi:hypothetical protein